MPLLRTAAMIALSVILISALRNVWPPVAFIDLPLIVVVYYALQRDPVQALLVGAACGLAMDSVGAGGLLGSGGFSKTVTAFAIVSLSSRVNIDNPLARIPVLAGAALLDSAVYVLMNRLLGNASLTPFAMYASYKLISTTAVGAIILFTADTFFGERARHRRQHASRRRIARRNIGGIVRRR
jgi:rod shape-determining protein MreD